MKTTTNYISETAPVICSMNTNTKISFKTGSVVWPLAFKRNKLPVRLFVMSFRGDIGSKGN